MLLATACRSPKVCFDIRADANLNPYDGQPHVVVLHLFPLETTFGFESAPAGDLLRGQVPSGVVARPLQVTVAPGEERSLKHPLPERTTRIGIVADYYRGPEDPEGSRKADVPLCGIFGGPTVILFPRDLSVE
jgi:type VI secretion system VasD/TssJ family lipoprotein